MNLPDDIIVEIIALIPTGRSVVSLQLSCPRMYNLLRTRKDVWRNICVNEGLIGLASCFPELYQSSAETDLDYEQLFKGTASCDLLCGTYEHSTGLMNAGECEWGNLIISNSDSRISATGIIAGDMLERKYQGLAAPLTPEEMEGSRRSGLVESAIEAIKSVLESGQENSGVCKRCKISMNSEFSMNEDEDSVICGDCAGALFTSGRRLSWDLYSYNYEEDDEISRREDAEKRVKIDEGLFNLFNQTCLEAAETSNQLLTRYYKYFRYKTTACDEYSDVLTLIHGIVFCDENNFINFIGKNMGIVVRSRLCKPPFHFSNAKFSVRARMLPSRIRGKDATSLMLEAKDSGIALVRHHEIKKVSAK